MTTKEYDNKYICSTYSKFNVVFTQGKGSLLFDENGKKYIDLGSGIAVNSFGVSDEVWENSVIDQLRQLQHVSNLYYTKPNVELAKLLCEKTGFNKVFFSNSGAEANETAIKAARKHAHDRFGKGHHTIITLNNSFHGRTMAALAATGQPEYHKDFEPLPDGFVYTEANNIQELKKVADSNSCCAIMIELIQGEGGLNVLSKEYVNTLVKIAKKQDLLVIVDEVQTGNGRTGSLYCYMNYGFMPDIMTTAKGLGGGLPIGATLFNEKTMDVLCEGSHGSTFGGNPVCAAGAISILERIDDNLLYEINKKSEYIKTELNGVCGIKGFCGMGLMFGIETIPEPKDVVKECLKRGVVTLTAKNKVRLLPALNIPFDELKEAVAILKDVIECLSI